MQSDFDSGQSELRRKRHGSETAALISTVSVIALVWLASVGTLVPSARAETLEQALSSAYTLNPQIDSQRATLRATDEGVARAMSGYRPNIRSEVLLSSQNRDTDPSSLGDGRSRPRQFQLSLTQPLFRGFRTVNAVSEAEANVRAGQQALRDVEQTVLQGAVTAYMDVVRDGALLQLREANLEFLSRELRATQDRFSVGEVTRTDVAQARAAEADALAQIALARANLESSRASYRQIIGKDPTRVSEPPLPRQKLPNSLSSAIDMALQENPLVVQSLYREQAARFAVEQVFGELLPSAQLEASYTSTRDPSPITDRSQTGIISGRLTIPLYQSGEVRARLRQAKHTHVSLIQAIEQVKRAIRQQTVQSWSLLRASQAQLTSRQAQVDANTIALNGVREEERVGQRTLLDVLEAQQNLLNARVLLISTQRDIIVNAYLVLVAIGHLDGISYGVASTVYDPNEHYAEVRREWWRISITDREGYHSRLDLWESFGRRHEPHK